MGRPVAVMGPSAYDLLGCARRIRTVDGIYDALDNPPAPTPQGAIPYGLMMQRRGFTYERLERSATGEPSLAGTAFEQAGLNAQKASDLLRRAWTNWLTRR